MKVAQLSVRPARADLDRIKRLSRLPSPGAAAGGG